MHPIELPLDELAADRTLTMPGPAGAIGLRLFYPRAARASGPVVVFYHGGGFVAGNIATHAPLAAEIARQFDPPAVSVTLALPLFPMADGSKTYSSSKQFAAKLVRSGVPVCYHEVPGMIHGFATCRRGIASAQQELEHALGLARVMLDREDER